MNVYMYFEGSKDTSKSDSAAASAAQKQKEKRERDALLQTEEGTKATGQPVKAMIKCKDCKKMYDPKSKKGCETCKMLLFGGELPKAGGGGKSGGKKK